MEVLTDLHSFSTGSTLFAAMGGPCLQTWGSGLTSSQTALLGFVVFATALVMISTRRRLRERQKAPMPQARERAQRLKQEKGLIEDLENATLQLERLAREVQGEIGSQYAKLQHVSRQAQEQIERLERLIRAAEGKSALDVTLHDDAESREVIVPPKTGVSSVIRQEPSSPPPRKAPSPAVRAYEDSVEEEDWRREIFELAARGVSPVDIAQRVNLPAGEVELILAIQRSPKNS